MYSWGDIQSPLNVFVRPNDVCQAAVEASVGVKGTSVQKESVVQRSSLPVEVVSDAAEARCGPGPVL